MTLSIDLAASRRGFFSATYAYFALSVAASALLCNCIPNPDAHKSLPAHPIPSGFLSAGVFATHLTAPDRLHTHGYGMKFGREVYTYDESLSLGKMTLRDDVCSDYDTHGQYNRIDQQSIVEFLQARGYTMKVTRARGNLYYVDLPVQAVKDPVPRLRVAILDSAENAGYQLNRALLQHGNGAWGVHRSNVAILAPLGTIEEIIEFAARTKIACWGILTVAGKGSTYVVPGGYFEL